MQETETSKFPDYTETTLTPMSKIISQYLTQSTELAPSIPSKKYEDIDWVEVYNNKKGSKTGENCDICKNKGVVYYYDDNKNVACKECVCMPQRRKKARSVRLINSSGLKETIRLKTFENFEVRTQHQKEMMQLAKKFLQSDMSHWLYYGGQVGAGKTHICTAVVGELLLKQGKEVRYLQWREDVPRLKAKVNDEDYEKLVGQYKTTDVLYIDDLFKTDTDRNGKITAGDINLAFEILNWRYQNKGLITIISSQLTVREIILIDEAIGSRIFERSQGYAMDIAKDIHKNYRLKGML